MVVGEGQLLGIGLDEADVAGHAAVQQLVAADLEHGGVDVGQHHFAGHAHQARELAGEVAGAAGDVQHAVARAHAGQLDGEALPQAMDAAGHQVVHQVVLGRNRVEHLGNLVGLLALRDLLVTEVGRGFGVVAFARVVHFAATGIEWRPF
ncbi:hypothetical protein D9M71_494580 [compost metagenome]